MKYLLAALVVVSALGLTGVGIGAVAGTPLSVSTVSVSQTTLPPLGIFDVLDGVLDVLQDLIERIDEFLEALVDLLETLNDLFGGGEGGD